MKSTTIQFVLLRIVLGALLLSAGIPKLRQGWLTSDQQLLSSLNEYQQTATGFQKQYIESVALPYVSIWSKLIAIGEAAIGVSLVLGLLARSSSAMGIFMLLNLHAANGNLFSLKFFQSPWAALFLLGLVMILLARAGRWFGFDYYLSKSNAKSNFW